MTDQNGRILEEGMTVVYYIYDTGLNEVSDLYKPSSELRQAYVVELGDIMVKLSDGMVIPSNQVLIT